MKVVQTHTKYFSFVLLIDRIFNIFSDVPTKKNIEIFSRDCNDIEL